MALKHLIQNKLIQTAKESQTFRSVSYDSSNEASISGDPALLGSDVLASCHANETSANFEVDPLNRRSRIQRKTNWIFELRCKFKQEICLEDFEQAWLLSPPVLTREDTSSKQVTLFLLSAEIQHPPQQTSSTGTRATFTILAELSRN